MAIERLYAGIKSSLLIRASEHLEQAALQLKAGNPGQYDDLTAKAKAEIEKVGKVDEILQGNLDQLKSAGIEPPSEELLQKIVDEGLKARENTKPERDRSVKRQKRQEIATEIQERKKRPRKDFTKRELLIASALLEINPERTDFEYGNATQVVSSVYADKLSGLSDSQNKRKLQTYARNVPKSCENITKKLIQALNNGGELPPRIGVLKESIDSSSEFEGKDGDIIVAALNRTISFEQLKTGEKAIIQRKEKMLTEQEVAELMGAEPKPNDRNRPIAPEGSTIKLLPNEKSLDLNGKVIRLRGNAWKLIQILSSQAGKWVESEDLCRLIYGNSSTSSFAALISTTRKKLGESVKNQKHLHSYSRGSAGKARYMLITGGESGEDHLVANANLAMSGTHQEDRLPVETVSTVAAVPESFPENEARIDAKLTDVDIYLLSKTLSNLAKRRGEEISSVVTQADKARLEGTYTKLGDEAQLVETADKVSSQDLRRKVEAIVTNSDKSFIDNFENSEAQFLVALLSSLHSKGLLEILVSDSRQKIT